MLFPDNQLLILVGLLCFCASTKHLGEDPEIQTKCRSSQMLIRVLEMNKAALVGRVCVEGGIYRISGQHQQTDCFL